MLRAKTAALAVAAAIPMGGAAWGQTVHPGEEVGLGVTGPQVPQLLKDARHDPYALPQPLECAALSDQIAALDKMFGPDLDAPQPKETGGVNPMGAIRDLLPYGGVIRFFTRAGHQEHALLNASLAGWERRGFLKAIARQMKCPGFEPLELPAVEATGEPAPTSGATQPPAAAPLEAVAPAPPR
ncbi:MAG: hypothetical protein KGO51_08505 [Alphaproteobacteria bacterium]|nr:hypothetical protein [Alphaproteobacteria bacterium]